MLDWTDYDIELQFNKKNYIDTRGNAGPRELVCWDCKNRRAHMQAWAMQTLYRMSSG